MRVKTSWTGEVTRAEMEETLRRETRASVPSWEFCGRGAPGGGSCDGETNDSGMGKGPDPDDSRWAERTGSDARPSWYLEYGSCPEK